MYRWITLPADRCEPRSVRRSVCSLLWSASRFEWHNCPCHRDTRFGALNNTGFPLHIASWPPGQLSSPCGHRLYHERRPSSERTTWLAMKSSVIAGRNTQRFAECGAECCGRTVANFKTHLANGHVKFTETIGRGHHPPIVEKRSTSFVPVASHPERMMLPMHSAVQTVPPRWPKCHRSDFCRMKTPRPSWRAATSTSIEVLSGFTAISRTERLQSGGSTRSGSRLFGFAA